MSNLEKMVAKVKSNNQPGIAITDHGNMYGAIEFYKLAKKYEVKPIIGLEAYCAIEDSMKKTKDEELAVLSLYNYVQFFNEKDKDKILNCLHFPHMAHSENNDPIIYKNKDELWEYLSFLYNKLETEEDWDHSTLDKAEIITSSKNAVQCSVEFNRRYKNKQSYASAVGIFTSTKKDSKWGLQLRTMIPSSDNVTLAGANTK